MNGRTSDRATADSPLRGEASVPLQLRDGGPKGHKPNGSFHPQANAEWKSRPDRYPAAKKSLAGTDISGSKAVRCRRKA